MSMNMLGKIGIIGGMGWIGNAVLEQMLTHPLIRPENVWISNRDGRRTGLEKWQAISVTDNNETLVNHCDTIILSVRPQDFPSLKIKIKNHLVISVMAGVSVERIAEVCSAQRIVRSMPNAAVALGLSYTPWFATPEVDSETLWAVQALFETCGQADRVKSEDHLDFFTALIGSGQGWVAFFESACIQCAVHHGIHPDIAERAVRQLFLGMGTLLAHSKDSVDHVIQLLVDYAGTTAAGLTYMKNSAISQEIENAVTAAYHKATSDMTQQ